MKKNWITLLCCLVSFCSHSQMMTVNQYIEKYKALAMSEMRRSGIPAAITLAQGIMESEMGNSDLALRSNNHFGIKCKSNWTGEAVYHDDDERGECFRKYNSVEESYRDHTDFLKNSGRYAFLFDLNPKNYKAWCQGLKRAGYATNPRYPEILIGNIERYDLQQYTLNVLEENEPSLDQSNPSEKTVHSASDYSIPTAPYNEVTRFNELKAVYVPRGTSLLWVATKNDLPLSRLLEFNDLDDDGLTPTDQWLYLERKRKQGKHESCKVQEGEGLHDISQKHGIQLQRLIELNAHLLEGSVQAGTIVRLRDQEGNIKPQAGHKFNTGSGIIHEVKPREGLYSISKKYNVSIDQLKKWNNLESNELKIGQQLIISK
jgi:LysM repeat protein